jgi:O-succinylbenzoic acid--CoA ligase
VIVVERAFPLPYALPFARALATSRGRFTHRRGWLLAIDDGADRRGWGDAAAWPGFGVGDERVSLDIAALCAPNGALLGERFASTQDIEDWLAKQSLAPEVAYAVELALLDLLGQALGLSIAQLLCPEASASASTHALVIERPDRRASCLKVKVGAASLDADLARVSFVRASSPTGTVLRLDAGGGWSATQAHEAMERLAKYDIELIEQPIAPGQLDACAELRQHAHRLGLKLALDEEVTCAKDVQSIVAAAAADVIVIKPMFVGGLIAARGIAKKARDAGVEVIVTNALESAVGRVGAVHLAAGLGGVHGLGGALGVDLASAPRRKGGRVDLPGGSGLGVAPNRRFLAFHGVPTGPTSSEIRETKDSIPHPIASAAIARPDHVAIEHDGERMTYRELRDSVARAATVLRARGIAPGMTVAIEGPRDARFVTWLHAISWLGATAAPLAPGTPEDARRRVLDAISAHAIVDARCPLPGSDTAKHDERFWPPSEARLLLCTSGTSDVPKQVLLSTTQLLLSAFGSAIRLGHETSDRWLCCLPLNHIGGLSILMRCAWYATTVVLHERFDVARVNRAIDDEEVTLVSLVPSMLEGLLDARQDRVFPSTLRALLIGGAAMSDGLGQRCRAINAPVAVTWGMTEAASQVATTFSGAIDGSAGAPVAFARVDARDGRLHVRGPLVGGAVVTGDCGGVDERGHVFITGRADDVIISGGENIAPSEIEAVLRRHPAVHDVAVIGVVSERWGVRPVAAYEADEVAGDELRAWCQQRLANYKIPDQFIRCTLPRTALGKVSRRALRCLVAEELELAQTVAEPSRRGATRERAELDECVHELRGGADLAICAAQRVAKDDGVVAQLVDDELDRDDVPQTDRPLEVGLRMNERQTEVELLEHARHLAASNEGEHLLERLVTELEHTTEKQDAGAIDLKKASGDLMNEGHNDDRR